MARPRKERKVVSPPRMEGFKPFGIAAFTPGEALLKIEEYESLRLVEYEGLSQEEAADVMNISRPTLTRIYNRALRTIARAFVEGKTIRIEGGDYSFDRDWYRCRKCFKVIGGLENHIRCAGCAEYGVEELIPIKVPR
jgi:predicted DNA-binding protein (UPF0251 family)